jgi:hypothetical protein
VVGLWSVLVGTGMGCWTVLVRLLDGRWSVVIRLVVGRDPSDTYTQTKFGCNWVLLVGSGLSGCWSVLVRGPKKKKNRVNRI